jgi:hypothetical protein
VVAIVLLIAGGLTLVYRGFSYTKETHQANIGSLHMSVDETQHVNIPVWAGIAHWSQAAYCWRLVRGSSHRTVSSIAQPDLTEHN